MAYNVNDCVELRWGAPDKSDEGVDVQAACTAGAGAKMTEYRAPGSAERRRPPRVSG